MGITVLFVCVNYGFETIMSVLFGPSDFQLTIKADRSLTIFFLLVVIIVHRQKYEVQVLQKYNQQNLHFGKVFHLPAVFLISLFATNTATVGTLVVQFLFLIAFVNFFWEKACRTLGIN